MSHAGMPRPPLFLLLLLLSALLSAVAASASCESDSDCEGNNPCAEYWCDAGARRCASRPRSCDDGDPCTDDSCSAERGCEHAPKCAGRGRRPRGSACEVTDCVVGEDGAAACVPRTIDCGRSTECARRWCEPATGRCAELRKDCRDRDFCTADRCVDGVGCVHDHVTCPQSDDPCVAETSCSPRIGCQRFMRSCPRPQNDSWRAECVSGVGCVEFEIDGGHRDHHDDDGGDHHYHHQAADVQRHRQTPPAGAVLTFEEEEEDKRAATRDAGLCDDGDPCTDDFYVNASWCEHRPKNCADNDLCTADECVAGNGTCAHAARSCAPAPAGCTPTWCFKGDGACYPAECHPTLHACSPPDCDDADPDTADYCDEITGACYHVHESCDDGDACTFDAYVSMHGCTHTPLVDPSANANLTRCAVILCNSSTGEIAAGERDCDDGDACSVDWCVDGVGCEHGPPPAPDPATADCVVFECLNSTTGDHQWAPLPNTTPCFAADACHRFSCDGDGRCRLRAGESAVCFAGIFGDTTTLAIFIVMVIVGLLVVAGLAAVMYVVFVRMPRKRRRKMS